MRRISFIYRVYIRVVDGDEFRGKGELEEHDGEPHRSAISSSVRSIDDDYTMEKPQSKLRWMSQECLLDVLCTHPLQRAAGRQAEAGAIVRWVG